MKSPQNKMIEKKPEIQKAETREAIELQRFYLPEYGVSVEATSLEEAIEKYQESLNA